MISFAQNSWRLAIATIVLLSVASLSPLSGQGQSQGVPQLEGSSGRGGQPGGVPGVGLGFELNHKFHDHDGEVIVVGQMQHLKGATVTIAALGEGLREYKLKEFCRADQDWIRHHHAEMRKMKNERPIVEKIVIGLTSKTTSTVVSSMRRLRPKGSSASFVAHQLEPLMKSSDSKIREEAFLCYASIAPVNTASINRISNDLRDPSRGYLEFVQKNAKNFITALKRYDIVGLPYLRAIAFSGRIDVAPADAADMIAEELKPDTQAVVNRKLAMASIAKTRLGEEAADILLEILAVQTEASETDPESIKQTIESLGRLGYKSETVIDALEEQAGDFEEEVKKALERIEKYNRR